jgi:hypothetical protein
MRLSEIYVKEIVLKEFWKNIEEELSLTEASDSGLSDLLTKANELVFSKFKINPNEKAYFIGGSARLYLYPTLRDAFGLTHSIGDLDIIIPNKEHWIQAGLENEYNTNGIYRPTEDGSIEAFTVWAPNRVGGAYANAKVRPTNQILNDATLINGYYYMSLGDIVDYKTALNRDKEQDVIALVSQYQKSNVSNRSEFLRRIVKLIGIDKAKEFLGKIRN